MKNIKILNIDMTFYIFIILFLFSGYKNHLIYIFITFIVHELGHIFFSYIFKVKIYEIKIYPFGGIIYSNIKLNIRIYKEFLIYSGGLIFQIILYLINIAYIKSNILNYYNLRLLYINLLPTIPLDGSKLIFSIVSKYISYLKCIKLNIFISILSIILLILQGIYTNNLNIMLALYLIMSLINEYKRINIIMNKFYLERYLDNFYYNKIKYHHHNNISKLKKEEYSYFYDDKLISEKAILSRKYSSKRG